MAAIFGHFLKSWEGKFSFQIEDMLSASIPCLFLLIYLAMPQNSETGRRQQHGEDVPKAQMVLKCQTLPEQSLSKGYLCCQWSSGKGVILETNGRRWKALSTVLDPEDVGGHGLVPAGTGDTDSWSGG